MGEVFDFEKIFGYCGQAESHYVIGLCKKVTVF